MSTYIIAFANQKGGVGKTTTAVNMAAGVAELRRRVLLIDLDPQANATSGLGLEKLEGKSIYRALLGQASLREFIQPTDIARLDVVPAELDLAGAEVDIARSERYLHRLREALEPISESNDYDFIFIDCPPSLGILTMNALTAAHQIIIPLQCEYYALEGLSVITRLVEQIREGGANSRLELEGIIMTMFDMRTNLAQQVVQEVVGHFGEKVYETLVPRSVRVSEAPSFGKPVITYDKLSTGAVAYRCLAKEFVKRRKRYADEAASTPPADEAPVMTIAELQEAAQS